eukprot:110191-Chlamydomonas_euryale.AAC.1
MYSHKPYSPKPYSLKPYSLKPYSPSRIVSSRVAPSRIALSRIVTSYTPKTHTHIHTPIPQAHQCEVCSEDLTLLRVVLRFVISGRSAPKLDRWHCPRCALALAARRHGWLGSAAAVIIGGPAPLEAVAEEVRAYARAALERAPLSGGAEAGGAVEAGVRMPVMPAAEVHAMLARCDKAHSSELSAPAAAAPHNSGGAATAAAAGTCAAEGGDDAAARALSPLPSRAKMGDGSTAASADTPRSSSTRGRSPAAHKSLAAAPAAAASAGDGTCGGAAAA